MELVIQKAVPEDAREYAACHVSSWRLAYGGIVPDDYLDCWKNSGAKVLGKG